MKEGTDKLNNKRIYYELRSQQARALAATAKNPKVAAVHLEMAELYERLASGPISPSGRSTAHLTRPSQRKGTTVGNEANESRQVSLAGKAFELKEAGTKPPDHPVTEDHANPGSNLVPRPDYPPSGAFDAEGHRPVLERSRKER